MRRLVAAAVVALACAAPASAQEPTPLLAAGDIAGCNSPGDEATAAILDTVPGTIATLGDNAYPDGTREDFANCFEPSWGRHKARIKPSPGNHEYRTPGAAGYYGYFGAAAGDPTKGYYSYDLGSWHIVALNSECWAVGGCGPGSPQDAWLRADLAASAADCTLAYFHHARFSSGRTAQLDMTEPFWKALYEHGADVILAGHDHIYERHAPQTPAGDRYAAYGIRQFIVGTGGHSHRPIPALLPTSEAADGDTFGILALGLRPRGYSWEFLPEAGKTFTDAGSGTCHGAPPDVISPTVSLDAPGEGAILRGTVGLAATAADDRGVGRVEFLVDITKVAEVAGQPYRVSWNSAVIPDGVRWLRARAVDTGGNPTNSASRMIVIDNALPTTTIVRAPEGAVSSTNATFSFRSEPGATFVCSLDRRAYTPCESPLRYENLASGPHTFRVRARDAAGNLEPIAVGRAWTVDVRAPITTMTATELRAGAATFRFASSERGSTFTCSVDGGEWVPCVSPLRLTQLDQGTHDFRVRATDTARNTDWTAATRDWWFRVRGTRTWITGSDAAEVLVGTPGADTLRGLGGNDVLRGVHGDDALFGGPGKDLLDAASGRDSLYTRDGHADELRGGAGHDRAWLDRRLDRGRSIEKRFAR